IPGYHWRYTPDGTKEKITTSSLSRVLIHPNSYQTRSDLFNNLIKSLLMKGNGYLVAKRNDRNEISEIHQLPFSTMPYIDPTTKQVFYAAGINPMLDEFVFGDITMMIPARDICHIRLYTPNHPLVGVSPIRNVASSIAANAAITNQQATFFSNMNRPSGILSTEMKLTEDQMRQLRSAWDEQSKGMNTGGVPILGSGMKWTPMSINTQDAQTVEAFNMTVEDISRAFRVPLPLINDNRHSTYNNVEQLIAHWLSGGLGFIMDHVENNLDKFFGLPISERVEFDIDMLMRTDFKGRIEGYTKAIQGSLMSPDEARSRFGGLKPVDNGNKVMAQQQMVPLGWMEEQAQILASAPAPEDDETNSLKFLRKEMYG
ncbi:MAG: phage portal protein, partial [Deltaproteobacteria bacterium]|nr:phage portal protein [Deltaproteobacteria bacterium]